MWKRDESGSPQVSSDAAPATGRSAPEDRIGTGGSRSRPVEKGAVDIGRSVLVKGELRGSEDLTVDGQVEGTIELSGHLLTISANGRIAAEISAKAVVVQGRVTGNVVAADKISISETGTVEGNITAPKVAIAEGAYFKGSIDMPSGGHAPAMQPARAATAAAGSSGDAKPSPGTPAAGASAETPAVAR